MQITARPQRSCKFTFISYSLTGSLFETLGWQSRSFCVLYCMVATGGFSILLRSMNLWQPHRDSGGRKKTLNRVTMFVQWPGGFRNRLYNVPSNFTRSCLQNNDVLLPRCKTNHRSDHVKVLQSFFSPTISFRPMTQWKVSNMTCHVDIAINVIVSFPRICYWQSQLSRTRTTWVSLRFWHSITFLFYGWHGRTMRYIMLGCIGPKVGIVLPSKPLKIYTSILLSGAADGIASFLEFLIASLGLKFDASRKRHDHQTYDTFGSHGCSNLPSLPVACLGFALSQSDLRYIQNASIGVRLRPGVEMPASGDKARLLMTVQNPDLREIWFNFLCLHLFFEPFTKPLRNLPHSPRNLPKTHARNNTRKTCPTTLTKTTHFALGKSTRPRGTIFLGSQCMIPPLLLKTSKWFFQKRILFVNI